MISRPRKCWNVTLLGLRLNSTCEYTNAAWNVTLWDCWLNLKFWHRRHGRCKLTSRGARYTSPPARLQLRLLVGRLRKNSTTQIYAITNNRSECLDNGTGSCRSIHKIWNAWSWITCADLWAFNPIHVAYSVFKCQLTLLHLPKLVPFNPHCLHETHTHAHSCTQATQTETDGERVGIMEESLSGLTRWQLLKWASASGRRRWGLQGSLTDHHSNLSENISAKIFSVPLLIHDFFKKCIYFFGRVLTHLCKKVS